MRNISSLIKSSKQTAIVFSLFLALVASVSFCEDPFSGDSKITEEETSKPKVEITETEIATAAGIEKIEEGYPIEGKIAANNLRLRSWPWGAVVGKYTSLKTLKLKLESILYTSSKSLDIDSIPSTVPSKNIGIITSIVVAIGTIGLLLLRPTNKIYTRTTTGVNFKTLINGLKNILIFLFLPASSPNNIPKIPPNIIDKIKFISV